VRSRKHHEPFTHPTGVSRARVCGCAGEKARMLRSTGLRAGEIVTTGTLTDALPIQPAEHWLHRLTAAISLDQLGPDQLDTERFRPARDGTGRTC
jgi:hypothetical protein